MIAEPFSCREEQTLLLSGGRPFKGSRLQTKAQRTFHYKVKSSQSPILLQDRHFEYQLKVIAAPFSCTEEQTLLLSGLRPFEGSRTQTKARRALHYKIKVLSIQFCSKIITLSTNLRWPELHFHVRKIKPCYLVVSGLSKAPSRKPRPRERFTIK